MALDPAKNFAYSLVAAGGHSAAATSVSLVSGGGAKFPAPSTDGAFNVVWWNVTDYTNPAEDPNVEIVRVTARSTDALTVTRAQESTSASTKNTSGKVYAMALCVTKKMIDDISTLLADAEQLVDDAEALLAGIANASSTTAGLVEIPTTTEVTNGDSTGGTGAFITPTPAQLAAQIQKGSWTFAATAGTASAATLTLVPAATALTHGMVFGAHITTGLNAGATLNVNGLGAKALYKYAGGAAIAVEAGDCPALHHHLFQYDSDVDVFLVINPVNGTLTAATQDEVEAFFGGTNITGAEAESLTNGSALDGLHTHSPLTDLAYASTSYFETTVPMCFATKGGGTGTETLSPTGALMVAGNTTSNASAYVLAGNVAPSGSKDVMAEFWAYFDGPGHNNTVDIPWMVLGYVDAVADLIETDNTLPLSGIGNAKAALYAYGTGGGFVCLFVTSDNSGVIQTTDITAYVSEATWTRCRIHFDAGNNVTLTVGGTVRATHATSYSGDFDYFGLGAAGNTNYPGAVVAVSTPVFRFYR